VAHRLTVRRFVSIGTASLVSVAVIGGGLILWARHTSMYALDRALRAVSEGRAVPTGIDLKLVGMEVALDDQEKLRAVLRNGFEITGSFYFWEAFPRRAFAHRIGLSVDIDMVCEVFSKNQWVIHCGQIKCMVSPCKIHLSSGGTAIFDSSDPNTITGIVTEDPPPNNSLERTRER
jgi:hypothetical protein